MTATPAWPAPGPVDRDELAAWTTAAIADRELGQIPPLGGPLPAGWTELVDGRGVLVRRAAGPDGAVPVWCIHGLGGSSADWVRLSGALSAAAPVYSVDLPGSGRSDPPPGGRYSPLRDAELVAGVIEQVSGRPVHLVGNSYGGVVATLLAARHPELVRTLTVISPAVPDLRLTSDRGADPRLGLLLVPGTAGLAHQRLASISPMDRARGLGELCFGHPELITDADYEVAAREHARRATLPWTYAAMVGTLRGLMSSYLRPGRYTFAAAAASVTVPTLVIWGTRDRLVDVRLARRATAAYPDAELLVLAECGHVAQMEDPRSTALAMLALWERPQATRSALDERQDSSENPYWRDAFEPTVTPDGRAFAGSPDTPDQRAPDDRRGSRRGQAGTDARAHVGTDAGAAGGDEGRADPREGHVGRAVPVHSAPYGNLTE